MGGTGLTPARECDRRSGSRYGMYVQRLLITVLWPIYKWLVDICTSSRHNDSNAEACNNDRCPNFPTDIIFHNRQVDLKQLHFPKVANRPDPSKPPMGLNET